MLINVKVLVFERDENLNKPITKKLCFLQKRPYCLTHPGLQLSIHCYC